VPPRPLYPANVGGLLERDREIARIGAALTQASSGVGRCIIFEGPAGIGKTALLDVVKAMAYENDFRVLSASGGELEIDFPFGVVRQLFAPVDLSLPTQGSGLFEALNGLFQLTSNLAESSPLLLAIDDAQWCDGASLRYLIYLQRRLGELPLAIVVATRRGEPGGDARFLDQLGLQGRTEVLHPAGLSVLGVGALLQTALSEIPHAKFTAAAYAATGGNPFLVRELATALIERQLRPTTQAAADVSTIGPEGVQRAILRRLAALGPGAGALARAVAVLGSGCELRHAAGLSRISDRQAIQLVESLVRVQILRDEPQLAFVHPLVRAAIYADLTAGARAQAHAEAAAILDRDGADADVVAAHLLESPALGSADVVEHLRMAARRAASHGAMDVASSYLRRAFAEPPGESQRPAVLRELGTAELAAGQPNEAAERLAASAALAEDFDSRVSIVLMRRHALVLADRIAEAVSIVDDQRAEPAAKTYADLLEAAAIGAGQLDFAVAPSVEPRLDELRSRARSSGLTEPLALAVAASSNALANGDLELTTTLAERAVGSMAVAHPQSDYTVEGQIAVALYLSERYDQLAELSSRWLDDARRRGSLPRFISMATMRAHMAYRAGSLGDAEADARDALEAARLYGHLFWLPGAVAALLNPLIDRGRLDEAEQLLVDTKVEEAHGGSSAFCWAAMFLPARGRLRVAQGRSREGLADLLACGDRHESRANRSPSLWAWRSESALVFEALGDHARAIELATAELALARDLGAPRALGIALRAIGLVTGSNTGLAYLTEAVAILAKSSARLEHARALVDLGAGLRRAGLRTAARTNLWQAHELAVRCDADLLVQRAREELLASGAHPRRGRSSGPDSLTPSELRVARLAAEGRSNPEIAHHLFLTRRTVETHLTHAYQKLEIASRAELADALGKQAGA
jgi:DNA-binding CsgD family transcriptional regulator